MSKERKEQVWQVKYDLKAGLVKYITRADGIVRQTFDIGLVHANHRPLIEVRGLKVTLDERTSSVPGAQIQAKMAARQEYFDLLQTEAWNKTRQGGGFSIRIEFEALAALQHCTVQEARDAFKDLPEATQAKLLTSKAVTAKVAEIRAEQANAASAVDFSDLLDEE